MKSKTNRVTPKQRRARAREVLSALKFSYAPYLDEPPERRFTIIDGERHHIYTVSALKKLSEAILKASDKTLDKTANLTIDELFERFVFCC